MPTNDVENANSRNKERYSFLANTPWIVQRNRKDAAKDPEAQENYPTFISKSLTTTRRKNLAMACIDYKNEYDMVPPKLANKYTNIRLIHKTYRQKHENMESGIDSWREKLS